MTKTVRIENGDTSDYIIVVEVWQTNIEGTDELVETKELAYPTALTELNIWQGRWLVIKEKE